MENHKACDGLANQTSYFHYVMQAPVTERGAFGETTFSTVPLRETKPDSVLMKSGPMNQPRCLKCLLMLLLVVIMEKKQSRLNLEKRIAVLLLKQKEKCRRRHCLMRNRLLMWCERKVMKALTSTSPFWHFVLLLAFPAAVCAQKNLQLAVAPDRETETGQAPLVTNSTLRQPSPDEGLVRNSLSVQVCVGRQSTYVF